MNVGALDGNALVVLAVVCVVAIVGKVGAGYGASRIGGLGQRDAATVAVLLNTRGLTELIALNAGLQARIISGRLFSVLVIMAVITTVITAPLLWLITGRVPNNRPASKGADAAIR